MPNWIPSWSTLRIFGNSRLVRATISIPLIGYMIIFNEEIVRFLNLAPDIVQGQVLDATLVASADGLNRLKLIYLGMCFLGSASFLFIFCCPKEVAASGTINEFIAAERLIATPASVLELKQRLLARRNEFPARCAQTVDFLDQTDLSNHVGGPLGNATQLSWSDWSNRNQSVITTSFSLLYELQDQSRSYVRVLIGILYLVGAFFLLVPSARMFWTISLSLVQ